MLFETLTYNGKKIYPAFTGALNGEYPEYMVGGAYNSRYVYDYSLSDFAEKTIDNTSGQKYNEAEHKSFHIVQTSSNG
jgi:hypothetical protein